MIYLDHNATTPVCPEAREAALPFLAGQYGNPSSGYALGREAKEAVELARERVAALIGAHPDEIVFTSCATEANNLALKGAVEDWRGLRLVTTAVEHPSVINPALFLMEHGADAVFLSVDEYGIPDLDRAASAIHDKTVLVSAMHANNETGTILPLAGLARLAHAQGAFFHADASQSLGKIPVNVDDLSVDLLTLAGHKVYAPKGVGALYVRRGVRLAPLLHGGGQERGLRSGTENVAFLAALGAACRVAADSLPGAAARLAALRDRLEAALFREIPGLLVNGHPEMRLPNTANLSFPGVSGAEVLSLAAGIFASTGAACHGPDLKVSHVLAAMGIGGQRAAGTVRLSVGRFTTEEEVDRAARLLADAWRSLAR